MAMGGCSSNAATSADAGAEEDTGVVGCLGQGDTYSANLQKTGALGKYTFTLVQATPAPPDLNGNVWTFKAVDATSATPDVSQLIVYPFMPLMGHGSDQTPTLVKNADGSFTASDIDFFMPGLWTVTLTVTEPVADAGAGDGAPELVPTPQTIDKGVYSFCVN